MREPRFKFTRPEYAERLEKTRAAMAEKDRIAPTIHAAARSVSLPAGVAAEGVGVTSAMT